MGEAIRTKPIKSILLTVDVEDWFQVENLRSVYPIEAWGSCEMRVEQNVRVLLDIFDQYGVKGTFFVLGWVADRYSEIVREIQKKGHEIASHGYNHHLCSHLSAHDVREDIHRGKAVLEDLTGQPVEGYRAPGFSINDDALGALREFGYKYDSSYNSFSLNKRHGRPQNVKNGSNGDLTLNNGMAELPISNLTVFGRSLPWGGGGYFRFWPTQVFEWGVSQILKSREYYVFYCHPWEFDPGQPREGRISWLGRYRHYKNLDQTAKRLGHFLDSFCAYKIRSCADYLKAREETTE